MTDRPTFVEPPDFIACVNCGEEIEAHFHDDGGYWCHSANGEERCGRPEKEGWNRP